MPHITIEHSRNVADLPDFDALLESIHTMLVETYSFNVFSLKSRVVEQSTFRVADGKNDVGFVHLQISIMPGRDVQLRHTISAALLELLKKEFAPAISSQPISVTVEIRELDAGSYSKFSNLPQ